MEQGEKTGWKLSSLYVLVLFSTLRYEEKKGD